MDCNDKWSQLPQDLLEKILKILGTRMDLIRLRAICSSWRSSLSLKKSSLPAKLPFPIASNSKINPNCHGFFRLNMNTFYRLEPSAESLASFVSDSSTNAWLVRIEEEKPGKLRLLHPLTRDVITDLPATFPKVLNLLEYRVFELCTAYTLTFDCVGDKVSKDSEEWKYMDAYKVAVPSSPMCEAYAIGAIDAAGELGIFKLGAEGWTTLGGLVAESPSKYDDVIYHQGKFYAVDINGRTVAIDSNLEVTQIATPLSGYDFGRYKHLVATSKDMFLVDMDIKDPVIAINIDLLSGNCGSRLICPKELYSFNVFQLKKGLWLPVRSVGDHMLFLPRDISLCVSARNLLNCEENCIFFIAFSPFGDQENYRALAKFVAVYHVRGRISMGLDGFVHHANFIWPPPTWIKPALRST